MKEFTGKNGRKWALDLDLGTADRIRQLLPKYDLFAMQENPTLLQALRSDPFELREFLAVALDGQQGPQEDIRTLLQQELNAEALRQVRKALTEEFLNFIPEERMSATSQLLESAAAIENDVMQTNMQEVAEGVKKRAAALMRGAIERLGTIPETAGSQSSDSPQS